MWDDADGDGLRDDGEPGLVGWTVFLDLNGNDRFDPGEPETRTIEDFVGTPGVDESGTYFFTDLEPGSYVVGEVLAEGWRQTFPVGTQTSTIGDRLFSVGMGQNGSVIQQLNIDSGAVLNEFPTPAPVRQVGAQGLAVSPTSLFYVDGSTGDSVTLWELDAETGRVIDSDVVRINIGGQSGISGLAYLDERVYLLEHLSNQLFVWNPDTDTLERSIRVQVDLVGGLTGASDIGVLFATNDRGQVFRIDPSNGTVLDDFFPRVGSLNGGLAYVAGELIASGFDQRNAQATRLDPQNGNHLGEFAISSLRSVSGLAGDGANGSGTGSVVHAVQVGPGSTVQGINFANQIPPRGLIQGFVWEDSNEDGVRSDGEAGLVGWTVYLDLNDNGQFDMGETSTKP